MKTTTARRHPAHHQRRYALSAEPGEATLIMMGFPLPLDPTPTTIEAVARRLGAQDRARLEWFPNEFRKRVVSPLHDADSEQLPAVVDRVALDAVRLFLRLATITAQLVREPAFAALFESPADAVHARIRRQLDATHARAAHDLREAFEWVRACLGALLGEYRGELVLIPHVPPEEAHLSDEELLRELRGSGGALIRGLLLTVAAIEDLYSKRPPSHAIDAWCSLALREMHAAANSLRADGVPVPTAITVPGMNPSEWRTLRASKRIRPEPLPAGVATRIVDELDPDEIWLFGSRGRGTHAPDSDWDLMVVLPDSVDVHAAQSRPGLAPLRRLRVDLVLVNRTDLDDHRHVLGTLAHEAVTRGRQVYAR